MLTKQYQSICFQFWESEDRDQHPGTPPSLKALGEGTSCLSPLSGPLPSWCHMPIPVSASLVRTLPLDQSHPSALWPHPDPPAATLPPNQARSWLWGWDLDTFFSETQFNPQQDGD